MGLDGMSVWTPVKQQVKFRMYKLVRAQIPDSVQDRVMPRFLDAIWLPVSSEVGPIRHWQTIMRREGIPPSASAPAGST